MPLQVEDEPVDWKQARMALPTGWGGGGATRDLVTQEHTTEEEKVAYLNVFEHGFPRPALEKRMVLDKDDNLTTRRPGQAVRAVGHQEKRRDGCKKKRGSMR